MIDEQRARLSRTIAIAIEHWAEVEFGGTTGEHGDFAVTTYIGHGGTTITVETEGRTPGAPTKAFHVAITHGAVTAVTAP